MKVIATALTQQKVIEIAENFFKEKVRLIPVEASIFEQYCIRCQAHKWIPGIWQYRIICRSGSWHFAIVT